MCLCLSTAWNPNPTLATAKLEYLFYMKQIVGPQDPPQEVVNIDVDGDSTTNLVTDLEVGFGEEDEEVRPPQPKKRKVVRKPKGGQKKPKVSKVLKKKNLCESLLSHLGD